MSRLRPEKLHVRFLPGVARGDPVVPRRYTLTHSDATGDLFLTVGSDYEWGQISGWYTRLMRDEVLAEWRQERDGPSLHVYCHVSGGLVFGTAGLRYAIFRRELPLVLEALRFGDRELFEARPELDRAPIRVHFRAKQRRYNRTESWGTPADYRIDRTVIPLAERTERGAKYHAEVKKARARECVEELTAIGLQFAQFDSKCTIYEGKERLK